MHKVFARRRKACNLRNMSLHCVQSDQSVSKRAQHAEKLNIPSQRQTGKVYLEERCITLAIGRRVENGVHIGKHIFRPKSLLEVASSICYPVHAQPRSEICDELWREVHSALTSSSVAIEVKREEIVSAPPVKVELRNVTCAENDIPCTLIDYLTCTTDCQPGVLSGQHMARHALAPVYSDVPVEDRPAPIKRTIQHLSSFALPCPLSQFILCGVILPLILGA